MARLYFRKEFVMAKRFYWLKLKEDFFRDKAMKKLRKLAGGDTYTIIYLKMMLLSISAKGYLYYEGVEDDFCSELALDLDENTEDVKLAVAYLASKNKIERVSEDTYFLPDAAKAIGSETAAAERKRNQREREKNSLSNVVQEMNERDNVTPLSQPVTTCHIDIDKDIDREKEKDLSNLSYTVGAENISTFQQHPTLQEVQEFVKQKNIHINVLKFYDYYEKTGWKTKSGQPITNWKGKVYQWASTEGIPHKKKQQDFVSENAEAYASLIYNLDEPFEKR